MNFIDTNILVYAYDLNEISKREKCSRIINSILRGEKRAYVSNQILAELFNVLTTNMKKPVDLEKSETIVKVLIESENFIKLNYNQQSVEKAIYYVKQFHVPFWDALIAATMAENNVFIIYTENEKDFKKIPGLKVVNPCK